MAQIQGKLEIFKSECLELCSRIITRVKDEDVLRVRTEKVTGQEQFSTASTVGVMLNGTTIDNTVFGGPAWNSGHLERGDVILRVENVDATNENIQALLIGNDEPGAPVFVEVAKGGRMDDVISVKILRMATENIQDRRRTFELFNRLKERAIADNDDLAKTTLDKTIELWNKMWKADAIHDAKIAQNVQDLQQQSCEMLEELEFKIKSFGLQDHHVKLGAGTPDALSSKERDNELQNLKDELERLKSLLKSHEQSSNELQETKDEIDSLRNLLQSMVPKGDLDKLNAEIQRLLLELEKAKRQMDGMVPKGDMMKNQDEAARLAEDLDRMKKQLEGMVSKSQLAEAQDKIAAGLAEIERLKKMLEGMVPKPLLDASQDKVAAGAAEIDRLKSLLQGLIPKAELEKSQDEVKKLTGEVERLKKLLEGTVAKAELDKSQDEVKKLTGEVERLKKLLEGTVAKAELDKSQDEVKKLTGEVERLKKQLESMVMKSDLVAAQDKLAAALAELERLQSQLKGGPQKADLDAARDKIDSLEQEIARLKKLLEGMVPKPQLDAANDQIKIQSAEIERLKKLLEGMVSKADLDALAAKLRASEEERGRLSQAQASMVSQGDLDRANDELERLRRQLAELQRTIQTLQSEIENQKQLIGRLEMERDELNDQVRPAPPVFSVPGGRAFSGVVKFTLAAPDAGATVYYSTDGAEPGPERYTSFGASPLEVELSESAVVKAVSVLGDGKSSAVASEEFNKAVLPAVPRLKLSAAPAAPPPEPPKVGVVGMLVTRYEPSHDVEVAELVPGGPASQCGQIRVGDLLLSINGQDVHELSSLSAIHDAIGGEEGSTVELRMAHPAPRPAAPSPAGTPRVDGGEPFPAVDADSAADDRLATPQPEGHPAPTTSAAPLGAEKQVDIFPVNALYDFFSGGARGRPSIENGRPSQERGRSSEDTQRTPRDASSAISGTRTPREKARPSLGGDRRPPVSPASIGEEYTVRLPRRYISGDVLFLG